MNTTEIIVYRNPFEQQLYHSLSEGDAIIYFLGCIVFIVAYVALTNVAEWIWGWKINTVKWATSVISAVSLAATVAICKYVL